MAVRWEIYVSYEMIVFTGYYSLMWFLFISSYVFIQLDSRTEVINEKDIELESLKKELLQHAQMADRAHHFAAHQPLVESLQKELGDAQVRDGVVFKIIFMVGWIYR